MAGRIRPSDEVVQANIKKWGIPQPEKEYKVLIHCTTYNHGKYIKDALEGFVMQKCSFPFCAIIIDDCSTDNNPEIIKEYAEKYPDIIKPILLGENHMQHGILRDPYFEKWHQSAKYIAQCEGDDYWTDPNKLQEQVSFLESHPSYAFSHTAIKYYFEEGNRICKSKDVEINSKIINEGLTPEKILLSYRIQNCTVVYRLDAYKSARSSDPYLFNGNFKMGDTQLWYQLYKEGNIYFYPEVCAIYRKHTGSATMEKSVYNNLQFTLSSAELRMYLAQRDGLSDEFCKYVQKWYNKSFIKCLAFNNSLTAKYPVNLKEDKLLYALYKTHLLKRFLQIYMSIDPWASNIKRLFTGRM